MWKKTLGASVLITVIVLSAVWTGWKLQIQRPVRPVVGSFRRSKVDGSGHSRGIVQVDLMRQIMGGRTQSSLPANMPGEGAARQGPTQDHPLLGRRAPAIELRDTLGTTWDLGAAVSDGPVVVVFYLGSTCLACVTHLVELDAALPRFRARGARVVAISSDPPEFSLERGRNFGGFQIPLLSDIDHTISRSYGAWKSVPGGDQGGGEARHGTFIIDRDGLVRWAYIGNRPFTDIEALVTELDRLKAASRTQGRSVSQRP